MRLTIGKKLGGTVLILVLLVLLIGVISYMNVKRISDNTKTSAASYEMEINLVEIGFGLLGYIKDHDDKLLEGINNDTAQFEEFQKQYHELGASEKTRALADQIKKEFEQIKTRTRQVIDSEIEQTQKHNELLNDYAVMDALLDDKIQASIRPDQPQADRKLETSMEMEININGIAKALGGYLRSHDEKYINALKTDEEDFRVFFNIYKSFALSSEEKKWANEMGTLFETNAKRSEDIIALEKKQIEYIKGYILQSKVIDEMLDKEIQVLTASDLQSAVTVAILVIIIITLVGIAAGGYSSYRLSRAITTPVVKISRWADRIAAGNLADEQVVISDDEIGDLNTNFKRMVANLREFTEQNRDAVQNLNSTSAEILAAIQQQASSTKEQAVAIQETTTTMEEVNQTGAQISEKARDVAQASEATVSSSVSGIQAVEDTNRIMESIKEQVELMAENIVVLSEKTQVIGEIITNVNDIAEQSNLLALNAAIEAVGAGEQGQRFSVVANEIKNLADRAKESTVQVRTILGEIQKGINTSVMATEEAVKRVDTGKTKSEVAAQTIKQLSDIVQESVRVFQQIVGGTNQQQIGLEQVTEALKNIRTATEQTASGIGQIEKAVANLNELSRQSGQVVERYQV